MSLCDAAVLEVPTSPEIPTTPAVPDAPVQPAVPEPGPGRARHAGRARASRSPTTRCPRTRTGLSVPPPNEG